MAEETSQLVTLIQALWENAPVADSPALDVLRAIAEEPNRHAVRSRVLRILSGKHVLLLRASTAELTRELWWLVRKHNGRDCSPCDLRNICNKAFAQVPARSDYRPPEELQLVLFAGLLLLGYVRPAVHKGGISFKVDLGWANDETFRVQLFGFSSSIPGFNEVFGGALLLQSALPIKDDVLKEIGESRTGLQVQGRVVLVEGPFGAGKSLLTWRIAADLVLQTSALTRIYHVLLD